MPFTEAASTHGLVSTVSPPLALFAEIQCLRQAIKISVWKNLEFNVT